MAYKPVIKFSAVPYMIGTGATQRSGYRPQLEPQQAVEDLAFCKEVVEAKRLSISADELLHAVKMLVEVGMAKVAADGRPRGIAGLLKFNRYANGSLESPSSAWNETCNAYVRAQLMTSAEGKKIDATFQNIDEGIGVKLDNVTWVGAQTVVNVIKSNQTFAAYGRHMEFDGTAGDTAKLVLADLTEKTLTCSSSDAAHAVFAWPTGWAPEAGTKVTFVMRSRGGVAGGEVYTSRKEVTVIG